MKKLQRLSIVMLALVLVCAAWLHFEPMEVHADEILTSGACGDGLTWKYEDGTLTISGSGPMYDYSIGGVPWYYWLTNSLIDTMVIESGITAFDSSAFFNYGDGIDQIYYEGTLEQWCAIDFPTRFANPTFDTANMYIDGQLLEGELVIPEGVTGIGSYAFACCGNLTAVVLPDSLQEIGEGAFWWCSSVTSIDLPQGLVSIGRYALERVKMDSITIPESMTEIGEYAFYDCDRLRQVTIPDWVTGIGAGAFADCDGLTRINIPDGITEINGSTFAGCQLLTEIRIPESVTRIGSSAFSRCASLTEIRIPEGVTEIGAGAFSGCSRLVNINLPDGLTTIGEGLFSGCGSLTTVKLPDSVTGIGEHAFQNCQSLRQIDIPEGVTAIGAYAFEGCASLTGIALPEGVTEIGKDTFGSCSSLTAVVMEDKITTIGEQAFRDCGSLTHVRYGGNQKEWNSITVGEGNENLTGAQIHCGEAYLDTCAVCKDPKIVNHDWSRVSGGYVYCADCGEQGRAVEKCGEGLTWSLEDGVLTVSGRGEMYDYGAAWQDFSMRFHTLVIKSGVANVGEDAFRGCTNLTDVTIGSGVTVIGWNAFYDCIHLSHISLPTSLKTVYFDAFGNCISLTSITLPNSVSLIRESAFSYCINLTEIIIPDSVTEIEGTAFYGCYNLTNVVIGKNVKILGRSLFGQCVSLAHILYNGTQEQWEGLEIYPQNEALENTAVHFGHSSVDTCEYCKNAASHVHRIQVTQSDENGHAYQCRECGYESGPEEHSLKWDWNNEEHWQECECGWEVGRETHDLTAGKCEVCGAGADPAPTDTAPTETTPTEPDTPEDPGNGSVWVAVGIVLAAAEAVFLIKRKPR